jgi:hypothetical protein
VIGDALTQTDTMGVMIGLGECSLDHTSYISCVTEVFGECFVRSHFMPSIFPVASCLQGRLVFLVSQMMMSEEVGDSNSRR